MKTDTILKKYVCRTPFTYLELHKYGVYSCCPSWLPNKVGSLENINDIWNGKELAEVQESILDGTYKFCSKTQCPYLAQLLTEGIIDQVFAEKSKFNLEKTKKGPTNINFAFDRSCNLSCQSCRSVAIMANGEEIKFIDSTIDKVTETFGKSITMIYLSGAADPFASKSIRKFLINFDKIKFPNVNHIHLHTNGLLLTKKMWEDMSNIHNIIKTLEISIDASNKETYEIIRRGGNWEILMENLEFISTLKLRNKRVSFVVQDTNYKEMENFYLLMRKKFNNKINVFFNKITNWGTYSDGEFLIKQIWNENHPEFNLFLKELNKINKTYDCTHNMYDIVEKHLPKKITSLI
jgi:MoaA/NifB/PqqE/SkfB family radical SAM enzyme